MKLLNNNLLKNALIVILAVLLIAIFTSKVNDSKYHDELEASLLDSLKITHNKLGQEVAYKRVINAKYSDLKRLARSNNKEIKELASIVDRKTQSATIIRNHVEFIHVGKVDTIYIDSLTGMPVYNKIYSDKWIDYKIVAGSDSILLSLKVRNEYQYKYQWIRKNIFHKYVLNFESKSLNPYSHTDEIISYSAKEKASRFGIGFCLGYGITNKGISPFVGIGITKNIIKF